MKQTDPGSGPAFNIKVEVSLPDYPVYVKGDSAQLTQVMMNLILNAEEALKERGGGKIVVSTEVYYTW